VQVKRGNTNDVTPCPKDHLHTPALVCWEMAENYLHEVAIAHTCLKVTTGLLYHI